MADYKVELIVTNVKNQQKLSTQTYVKEETAEKILADFHSSTGTFPFLGIADIR